MSFSPLLQSIIERHGYKVADEDNLDAAAGALEHAALFFAGDAERMAESNDVAVILPELDKAFAGAFTPLVVAREAERALQRRYRFNAYPTLVFLRRGQYLGAIQGVQDWIDYLQQIRALLTSEPSDPPPFKFPEGCGVPQQAH
ncbi:hydrogenase-1 expression HyaE [Pelagibius marinus]|uniref:hydrogenase-1 expression HyaE n=1 Tax=Pelagibius marinus TaxID=2762760 RepID=UPI00187242B9|nr:hydrogenase-1 expression HyaE [Pelagibius marinus]